MEKATISIAVDPHIAQAFQAATLPERRKLELLLELRLEELIRRPARPLSQILDDAGSQAALRGITPEILDTLLGDE